METQKDEKRFLSPEILRARALEYARREEKKEIKGELKDFLHVRLGGEDYLIDSGHVDEVVPLEKIAKLPRKPDFLLGVMNVRGDIVPVADPASFLGLPPVSLSGANRVLLLRTSGHRTGLMTEEVVGHLTRDTGLMQPALAALRVEYQEFLKGIFESRGSPEIWIDMDRLMAELESKLRQ